MRITAGRSRQDGAEEVVPHEHEDRGQHDCLRRRPRHPLGAVSAVETAITRSAKSWVPPVLSSMAVSTLTPHTIMITLQGICTGQEFDLRNFGDPVGPFFNYNSWTFTGDPSDGISDAIASKTSRGTWALSSRKNSK